MTRPADPPSPEALLAHREWIRAIARSLVGDENAVDDVEQRTWLTVMRNRVPVTSIRGWLRRVVRSAAVDEQRASSRRRAREEASAKSEKLPPTDHLAAQAEAQRAVAAAVTGLPEPYRTTVLLRYFEELPLDEVATRMGVPLETVRTRLRRAHALLRDALDRDLGDRRRWAVVLLPLLRPRHAIPIGAATGGALIMAGKAKVVAVVAAVLVLTAGVWWAADSATRTERDVAVKDVASPAAVVPASANRPAATAEVGVETIAGVTVGVDVVDTAGRPVAGAHVELTKDVADPAAAASASPFLRLAPSDRAAAGGRTASTSAAGAATVTGVAPGAAWLRVAASGFALHESRVVVTEPSPRRRVVLRPGCPLAGRVLRADGSPVAAAGVLVGDRRTTSDAAGAYRFESLAPGVHAVRVAAGGVVQELAQVSVPEVARLELRLNGGCVLRGRVVDDETGTPLAGARVTFGATVYDPPRMLPVAAEAVSGDDGGFAWTDLPSSVPYYLRGERDGYADLRGDRDVLPPGLHLALGLSPTVELRMRRGAVVRGRVLRDDGSPVGGAVVDLVTRSAVSSPVASGVDGAFAIRAQPGVALVRVRADGVRQREFPADPWTAVREGTIPASCKVVLPAQGETAIVVVVVPDTAPRGAIAGIVRRGNGDAAGDATVEVAPVGWDEDTTRRADVDATGAFRADGLKATNYVVRASAGGCAPAKVEGLVIPQSGVLDGVDVVLVPEKTISGRVVDAARAAIDGAQVSVAASMGERGGATVATSGADGAFVVRQLAAGDWFVTVRAAGFAPANATIAAGKDDAEFRLERALAISGTVVDAESGAPLAGVPLRAEFSEYRQGSVLYRETASDASGAFVLTDLPPDSYRIAVGTKPERWPWGADDFLLTSVDAVRAGATGVRVAVSHGLAIGGRVVDDGGRPAGGGVIDAVSGKDAMGRPESARRARVGADGTFRLAGLAPGAYDLAVGQDGRDPGPVRVASVHAGAKDVVVTVADAQCIEGRLLGEDGTPLPQGPGSVEARWTAPDGQVEVSELPAMWGKDGRFRTNRLDAGRTYDIVVMQVPGRLGAVVRGVRPGTKDLDVVVRTGGRIAGRVLDASGNAVPAGVYVSASAVDADGTGRLRSLPGDSSFAKTTADGRFEVVGLRESKYELRAGGDPSEFVEARIPQPVAPGTTDAEFRLERGAAVSGRLVDAKGAPLKAGVVLLGHEIAAVDENGAFSIRGLKPGRYALRAQVGNRTIDLGEVQAPADGLILTVRDE